MNTRPDYEGLCLARLNDFRNELYYEYASFMSDNEASEQKMAQAYVLGKIAGILTQLKYSDTLDDPEEKWLLVDTAISKIEMIGTTKQESCRAFQDAILKTWLERKGEIIEVLEYLKTLYKIEVDLPQYCIEDEFVS